ncbi:MAG: CpaF family protein [Bacillota bacterium]
MSSLYARVNVSKQQPDTGPNETRKMPAYTRVVSDAHRQLKDRIQKRLVDDPDARSWLESDPIPEQHKVKLKAKIMSLLQEEESVSPLDRDQVTEDLFAEILGYGPLQPLLDDPDVTEIMVNSANQVYVERGGRIQLTDVKFSSDAQILRLIDKIVSPLGRRIDEGCPMVDARLPDGSRVNAIIHPLALKGPALTIRKFSKDPYTIQDLIAFGTLSPQMAEFLEACVVGRLNMIVSGGTGSGKTTTLNVLSSFIPADERIITIEDAAELQLRQDHVVSLETRPPNIEGKGEVTMRQLVRNALRMRPDRIVIGEVRTGEALDMLQAMNTGHDGSLTTCHANNPRDVLSRLETMVMMAGMELPLRAIREQIASALDIIVHQARMRDGKRRITHVTEVQGMEGDVIILQDLYIFKQEGFQDQQVRGFFRCTGIVPRCYDRLLEKGINLSQDLFSLGA